MHQGLCNAFLSESFSINMSFLLLSFESKEVYMMVCEGVRKVVDDEGNK